MRTLSREFTGYGWAPSTAEIASIAGIDPIEVVRYDANVAAAPLPSSRPGAIAGALARINSYAHGGYPELVDAIARYAGVGAENIVLGAGADDLILLCARAFAGPGDTVAIADEPTYPLFRIGAWLAGAEVGDDDPALTFCCRPNNPTGALDPLPDARPLVVDEAYFEYCGETAVGLIDDGVIVIRTFSKAFALAGCTRRLRDRGRGHRAGAERAAGAVPRLVAVRGARARRARVAAGRDAVVEERERLARALRALGLEPLPSHGQLPLRAGGRAARALRGAAAAGARRASVRDRHPHLGPRRGGRRSARRGARADARQACARRRRRRAQGPPPARNRGDAHRRPARARRRLARARRDRRRSVRPLPRAARVPRRLRPDPRRLGRPRDRESTTRRRTPRSRSARRSTPRSATVAGSRATATPSCRWTTRSRARPSISAVGPRRS